MDDYTRYQAPNGYIVGLDFTGKIDHRSGHAQVSYYLARPDGSRVFEGKDFGTPSHMCADGPEAATALLSFLTVQPGDVEEEYFEKYNPEQLAWCQSEEAEDLSLFALELEEGKASWIELDA
jgi:hypothetical protein